MFKNTNLLLWNAKRRLLLRETVAKETLFGFLLRPNSDLNHNVSKSIFLEILRYLWLRNSSCWCSIFMPKKTLMLSGSMKTWGSTVLNLKLGKRRWATLFFPKMMFSKAAEESKEMMLFGEVSDSWQAANWILISTPQTTYKTRARDGRNNH